MGNRLGSGKGQRGQIGKGRGVSLPWRSVEREIEVGEVDEKSLWEGLSLLIKVILVGRDKGRSRKIKDCYSCLWLLDNQQDMALGTSESQKG